MNTMTVEQCLAHIRDERTPNDQEDLARLMASFSSEATVQEVRGWIKRGKKPKGARTRVELMHFLECAGYTVQELLGMQTGAFLASQVAAYWGYEPDRLINAYLQGLPWTATEEYIGRIIQGQKSCGKARNEALTKALQCQADELENSKQDLIERIQEAGVSLSQSDEDDESKQPAEDEGE